MKTIKVYAFPSHQTKTRNSGVDYARLLSPMKYLDGFTYKGYKFKVDVFDIHKTEQDSWLDIAESHDLVFMSYTVMDWHYAAMASVVRGKNKKIILDIDDSIWHVQKDNVVYNSMKQLNAGYILTCICDDVDGIITTNGYLRNVIVDKSYKRYEQIKVIENQVDFSLYNKTSPTKETNDIMLLHYGSTSHFEDLLDPEFVRGIDRIFSDYPNVKITMVGAFISELKMKWGSRYINAFGHEDIYKWIDEKFPVFMDQADIMVVPLRDTVYNRCKSDIKWLETATAMKPGVFSDTRPYREAIDHGKTGLLSHTADEWYENIKLLIDNVEKRREIGKNAYEKVQSERQIQDHVKEYAEYFLQVLGKV